MPTQIERICLCGCGEKFKVFKTNKTNYFYSLSHAEFSSHRKDLVGQKARELIKKSHPRNMKNAKRTNKARRKFYRTYYLAPEIQ